MKTLLALFFAGALLVRSGAAFSEPPSAASIPTADLLQPAELAANLKSPSVAKPLILQVGFHKLYTQAHIPSAEYAGAAGDAAGLQLLRQRVAALSKDSAIVLYCGCCPWTDCPNIAAAYGALHALGFARVKVLYIAENFGDNWVKLGYPVTSGG